MSETLTPSASWSKDRFDPLLCLDGYGINVPWLTFDPGVVKGVTEGAIIRRRQCRHDGTAMFTYEIVHDLLIPLVRRELFDTRDPPANHPDQLQHYTLGWLHLSSVYGTVDLPVGRYPGQRERASIAYTVRWE
jgi:hypothetical protein